MLHDTATHLPAPPRTTYHWTLPRQRSFLEHLAISGSVTRAAAYVGVSPRAAYDLRHRRDGLLFGLGWGAAVLLARYHLTDLLLERAIDGVEEVAVRSPAREDGSAEYRRRKYDGRLGLGMLARLDRMALPAADADAEEVALHRAVAQDFESFLDRLSPPPEPQQPAGDAASTVVPTPAAEDASTDLEATTPADSWEQALWPDPDTPDRVAPAPLPPTPIEIDIADPAPLAPTEAPTEAEDRNAKTVKMQLMREADALMDAKARIAVHLAAQAEDGSPLGRLAQETRLHCEVAQKSATSAADLGEDEADWSPPQPTQERARELQTQIHDCLDRIEDKRFAAGLAAFNCKWDCIEMTVALGELVDLPDDQRIPTSLWITNELNLYASAWADSEPDTETAHGGGSPGPFSAPEVRREDSIKKRIDRLMAIGKARAVQGEPQIMAATPVNA